MKDNTITTTGKTRVNGTCATNRRSRAAIRDLRDQLHEIVRQHRPATCRQIFYQAVSRGLIEAASKKINADTWSSFRKAMEQA